MRTFTNPVSEEVLGDPFVLKWNGRYFAYGTPPAGPIPVLTSTDLVTWTRAGEVLPPPPEGQVYWAPEVAYDNGTFFLYHSVGAPEGEGHRMRVATASSPLGPFAPVEEPLDPPEPFSIDASPFRDVDGRWYLFSCRDFLEGERVGTGIVVHALRDPTTLDGPAVVVVRPHAEWHVYERQRRWYDRVWDWYTVEGPFVVRHGGRYWCFFSGGAWRAENYGVSWAVADHPLGPWSTGTASDGAEVLRTVPGAIGPGHASLTAAPDNLGLVLVYHAWDEALTGRRMCVDQLRWGDDRLPATSGPSVAATSAPPLPAHRTLDEVTADAALPAIAGDVLVEVNARGTDGGGSYGVMWTDGERSIRVELAPAAGSLRTVERTGGHPADRTQDLAPLRPDFVHVAWHQLLFERRGGTVQVALDGVPSGAVAVPAAAELRLWSEHGGATFTGITVSALPH